MTNESSPSTIRRVVAPTDFSEAAGAGLAWAKALALPHGAKAHLVHVVAPIPVATDHIPVPPEAYEAFSDVAEEKLESLADGWRAEGLEVTCHVTVGSAALGIVDVVESVSADLVVLSTRGRTGLKDLFLGSTARGIVRRAPCPVLSVQPEHGEPEIEPATILAPVDFSTHSLDAIAGALEIFPLEEDARLVLLHVWQIPTEYDIYGYAGAMALENRIEEADAEVTRKLEELADSLRRPGLAVEARLVAGYPSVQVIEAARSLEADLLVLGTQGLRGIERWLLGSVAERVVQRAPGAHEGEEEVFSPLAPLCLPA